MSNAPSIKKTVVSAVIAGGILWLFLPAAGGGYGLRLIPWAWSHLSPAWRFLFSAQRVPGGVLLLLTALALVTIVTILRRTFSRSPEWLSYVQDEYHGAVWRWQWHNGQMQAIWSYCPRCDATLVSRIAKQPYDLGYCDTAFLCEHCNHSVVTTIQGDTQHALMVVRREFERRLRTGEYKQSSGDVTTTPTD